MRAFIAVDAAAVDELAALQRELLKEARWTKDDVKPVEPENFHFTLIFLGEIQDSDVANISKALSEIRFAEFPLNYSRVGAFPRPDGARVVWVGVDPQAESHLSALAQQVAAKMQNLGFSQDKPFSAHLTLFRARNRPVRAAGVLAKFQSLNMTASSSVVRSVHLKKSELKPSGPVYSNVYTVEASAAT